MCVSQHTLLHFGIPKKDLTPDIMWTDVQAVTVTKDTTVQCLLTDRKSNETIGMRPIGLHSGCKTVSLRSTFKVLMR